MSVRRSSIRGTYFPDGVPNILRIFYMGDAKYSRIFCAGVQKIGDAKYPMTPGEPILGGPFFFVTVQKCYNLYKLS